MIEGVEPDAMKVASPVLNGGDEETGLVRPRLVATKLQSPSGNCYPDIPCLICQSVNQNWESCPKVETDAHYISRCAKG